MLKNIKEQGEQSKIEGLELTAINMIKKNFDNITINEITGLSVEKIEELRKPVNN